MIGKFYGGKNRRLSRFIEGDQRRTLSYIEKKLKDKNVAKPQNKLDF